MLTRFGYHFASTTYDGWTSRTLFPTIAEVARAAEASGFDSLWTPDHTHQNAEHKDNAEEGASSPLIEAYTLMSALAAHTSSVRLGVLASPITFRNPALVAKMVASLDVVSGGRAVAGLGSGWEEAEHRAYGINYPPTRERMDRLEEAVQIYLAMTGKQPASFAGRYYTIEGAWNSPPPIQDHVPLVIAGSGERRTLPLVARYGDACNFFGSLEEIERKLGVLSQNCERYGRDPGEITRTVGVTPPDDPDELCRMVEKRLALGVDAVILFGVSVPSAKRVSIWGDALQARFG